MDRKHTHTGMSVTGKNTLGGSANMSFQTMGTPVITTIGKYAYVSMLRILIYIIKIKASFI